MKCNSFSPFFLHIYVLLILSIAFQASKAQDLPKKYVCQKVAESLKIDGSLKESDWQKASWTDLFVDIEGDKQPKPFMATRAKILWDDSCLYIAAMMEEKDVWAYQTIKDQIVFEENDFEVFIDPDGDGKNYFEMEVNAANNTFDLFLPKRYKEHGKPDHGYDMKGFKSAISIQGTLNNPSDKDSSWVVEMAIPFSAFTYREEKTPTPKSGTVWRINFSRVNWQTEVKDGRYERKIAPSTGKRLPEYNWVWSPQGVIDMHQPETWGYLEFVDKTK